MTDDGVGLPPGFEARAARVREMEPCFHGEYTVVLADGTRLKLSRTYRAKLQAALGEEL